MMNTLTSSVDAFIERVHSSFPSSQRSDITSEEIIQVLAELDLDIVEHRADRPASRLQVRRLRFVGQKELLGQDNLTPIDYNQRFEPGVNVLFVPGNDVGKSSILKTIKFALTGDDSNYDPDVQKWITDVWLQFTLDDTLFTILMAKRDSSLHALLRAGVEERSFEQAAGDYDFIFKVDKSEAVKEELRRFFFLRLNLSELSWTQEDASVAEGVSTRSTSWLTYFQALVMPDAGDRYLLCDPQHAMGGQEAKIFSALLGLHLAEPLNRLNVEEKLIEKRARLSTEERRVVETQITQLDEQIKSVGRTLAALDQVIRQRRDVIEQEFPALLFIQAQDTIQAKKIEQSQLIEQRDQVNSRIFQDRGRVQRMRQAVALHLHFTGLDVKLCPNCDTDVAGEDVEREREVHSCRLCGKQAHFEEPENRAIMERQAEAIESQVRANERARDAINTRLSQLRVEIVNLTKQAQDLDKAARQGASFAFPTPEESAQRDAAVQDSGRLQAEIAFARHRLREQPSVEDKKKRILKKVRDRLREEAEDRNSSILDRLAALTEEVVQEVGAESISSVKVSALGAVQLKKHGEAVRFSGINNQGERLRVKLAFFLAMMRLGREPGLGRHPGFLLIDQPGSAEMVPADAQALARVFRQINTEMNDQIQILCFTSRPEFQEATVPEKVYNPQAGEYVF